MKRLFILVAILFMVSIRTPAAVQETWDPDKLAFDTFEQWAADIQEWFTDQDISIREYTEDLNQLIQSGEETQEGTPDTDATDPSTYEKEVVKLVNDEREKRDLEPLEMDNRLSSLARKKSQDMADNNYFSHTSPTYGSPFDMMEQFDFTFRLAGENIAAGQRSPEQVVEGWMNSEGHRENILKEGFTHIGVGYVEADGLKYGTYWTQMFMTPR
ncbi:CAP domain-containing protein [Lentibacillus sp. CBA3610]|uniref:CAP domain-containing protein n=1 Tax=Lentibacillus sp. CBA3610 TaxID=2518176 RepID=UPI0020D2477E|nr:CAP domain-containing protein [Lentibacillus sp. CBA3610]